MGSFSLKFRFCLLVVLGLWNVQVQPSEHCKITVPQSIGKEARIDWLIQNELLFKQQGCWSKHLELGIQALDELKKQMNAVDEMRLSLQLASSSFYLGNYDRSYKFSTAALALASRLQNVPARVEALYLQSAVFRARHLPQAVPLAAQALAVLEHSSLNDPLLIGKIHFNLGAAYSDASQPDLIRAFDHLGKAYHIFVAENQGYDALRAGLRRARVAYLNNDFSQAQELLVPLGKWVDSPRGQMLFDYQSAKVMHRQRKWDQAKKNAEAALEAAIRLEASIDEQRIRKLLLAINNKTFVVD